MADELSADLVFALRLADEAAAIAVVHFEQGVAADLKADGSPVTIADHEVEEHLVSLIAEHRPDDGVLSEEGATRQGTGRRWVIDPVDGTVNFAEGSPHWGTHVALEVDGEVVLGVVTRPVLGQRWWASGGRGTFEDDGSMAKPVRLCTSEVDLLEEARVTLWPPKPGPLLDRLRSLDGWVEPDWTMVPRLLRGDLDVIITAGGGPWDHAPIVVLTEEAGGRFWDHDGGRRLDINGGVFSNGALDGPLAAMLASLPS